MPHIPRLGAKEASNLEILSDADPQINKLHIYIYMCVYLLYINKLHIYVYIGVYIFQKNLLSLTKCQGMGRLVRENLLEKTTLFQTNTTENNYGPIPNQASKG